MLKEGFFTALGTPLDDQGRIIIESLKKQIEDQIAAGAAGLFLFGTMGMGGCVKNSEYEGGLIAAVEAVDHRCALLVSASENSLAKVTEKLAVCEDKDIAGVVMTAPYYFKSGDPVVVNFLKKTAAMTKQDFYLYDHEPITKHKLNMGMLRELADAENFKGLKTFDLVFAKQSIANPVKEGFTTIFSGSDLFDLAYPYGIRRYMDGIFACMPKSIAKVQKAFAGGDNDGAKKVLGDMMGFRDQMHANSIWVCFSYAMNMLGYAGNFAPDYELPVSDRGREVVKAGLAGLGEI